jgi:hypothetical protein
VSADALSRIEWPYDECPWPQVDCAQEKVVAAVLQDAQTPVLDWVAEQEADDKVSVLK